MTHSLISENPYTFKNYYARMDQSFTSPILFFYFSLTFSKSDVSQDSCSYLREIRFIYIYICCEIKPSFHTYKIYSNSKYSLPVCHDKCGHGIYSHLFVLGFLWSTVIGIHVLLHDALPHFFSMYFGRIDLIVGPPPPSTPRHKKKYVIKRHKQFAVCPLLNSITVH